MIWITEWRAIAAEIQGFVEAGRLYSALLTPQFADDQGVISKVLAPHASRIFAQLRDYRARQQALIPAAALDRLTRVLGDAEAQFEDRPENQSIQVLRLQLTTLASLKAELDHLLSDFGMRARRLSERAFAHLQRSIVADKYYRERWKEAFQGKGEVECEKLGAVHLLQHGIWAFKVNALGERTDLVFQEPLLEAEPERTAEALVLTEWKAVRAPRDLESKLAEAGKEADQYAGGCLSALELAGYRYLVMVTKKAMTMPGDRLAGDIVYRNVNIAVDPDPPSTSARKQA